MIHKKIFSQNSCWFIKATAVFLLFFISWSSNLKAQSFYASNIKLYDFYGSFFIQEIPIEVTGLPNNMTESFGLETVGLTIHHNRVSDLKIQLQSPDGTTIWVTNRNGGVTGKNYLNTNFSQFGKNGLINNGVAPFDGDFTPSGEFS